MCAEKEIKAGLKLVPEADLKLLPIEIDVATHTHKLLLIEQTELWDM